MCGAGSPEPGGVSGGENAARRPRWGTPGARLPRNSRCFLTAVAVMGGRSLGPPSVSARTGLWVGRQLRATTPRCHAGNARLGFGLISSPACHHPGLTARGTAALQLLRPSHLPDELPSTHRAPGRSKPHSLGSTNVGFPASETLGFSRGSCGQQVRLANSTRRAGR